MRNSSLNTKFRPVSVQAAGVCLALMAALILASVINPSAVVHSADTINVTTTTDEYGTGPGQCSLREAIESINTDTSFGGCTNPGSADTIQLEDAVYNVTIPRGAGTNNAEGSLMPKVSMTIQGRGPTIPVATRVRADNALNDTVFTVVASSQVVRFTMTGLAVQNGPKGGIRVETHGSGAADSEFTFSNLLVGNKQLLA